MAFLRNDAVNRVNLHYGIQALAQSGGAVFFLVFMLRAGVSIPGALLAMAAILAGRMTLRPAVLLLAKRWGLKPLLILGTFMMAVQYPLLAEVRGVGVGLAVLCFVTAVGEVLYWPAYHAYFAALGDAEHRGHQVGAREALASVVGIIAPLAGAWALVTLGPRPMFAAVGLIQALSAVPLFGAPNVAVKARAPGTLKAARLGMAIYATHGWFAACFFLLWQIALFVSLGRSLSAYGGAMALAALVGAICGLLLGRHIDQGGGRRAVAIAYAVAAAVVLLRAASFGSPWLAVAANALGAVVGSLIVPSVETATYNLAKVAPCPLRFNIATEGAWDVGCFGGCLLAAGVSASGAPLSVALLMALPMLGVGMLLLRRYYRDVAAGQGETQRA